MRGCLLFIPRTLSRCSICYYLCTRPNAEHPLPSSLFQPISFLNVAFSYLYRRRRRKSTLPRRRGPRRYMSCLRRRVHLRQQAQTSSYDPRKYSQWHSPAHHTVQPNAIRTNRTYPQNQTDSWNAKQSACSTSPIQLQEIKKPSRNNVRNHKRRWSNINVALGPTNLTSGISVLCCKRQWHTDAQTQRAPTQNPLQPHSVCIRRSPVLLGQRGAHVPIGILIVSISIAKTPRHQHEYKIKIKNQSSQAQGQRHDREERQGRRRCHQEENHRP